MFSWVKILQIFTLKNLKVSVPIVLAASFDEQNETPSVNIDYTQAAYDAMKHFIEQGHKRIGFVSGPFIDKAGSAKKLQGYKKL